MPPGGSNLNDFHGKKTYQRSTLVVSWFSWKSQVHCRSTIFSHEISAGQNVGQLSYWPTTVPRPWTTKKTSTVTPQHSFVNVLMRQAKNYLQMHKFNVVYRVPATGTRSPLIVHRQSLWLADMRHTYRAADSERRRCKQSKWCRRSSD